MQDLSQRNRSIDNSHFAMVPRAEIPRSTFLTTHAHKTTFDAGYLIPIYVGEVLPADVFQGKVTVFARLNTMLFPIMDHVELETFFFFVPSRILWANWVRLMGERVNPSDSISYTVPIIQSPTGGFANLSIYDYMGVPGVGQIGAGNQKSINALPLRAYNMIYNKWFRDENLENSPAENNGSDGPDSYTNYNLMKRNKRKDYFTGALPWPLKGGTNVTMPLSGSAPVLGLSLASSATTATGPQAVGHDASGNVSPAYASYFGTATAGLTIQTSGASGGTGQYPLVYADLSQATGATINALRTAFQTQRLLERDARGGTRYTEMIQAHFGVHNPDGRLQRPEYIGGGRTSFATSAIPQTAPASGGSTPLAALGAQSLATDRHSFELRATEFGYIIGLASVRADLTYQQGLHRMWTRSTRYDFYHPVFAFLGEQAIRNDEIYCDGSANDTLTFGYQERWAEYRYEPGRISGMFRSTTALAIDGWHLAQKFTSLPGLNQTFIEENPPMARAMAAGSLGSGLQVLFDSLFEIKKTRPMPMYSVPGMIDHF